MRVLVILAVLLLSVAAHAAPWGQIIDGRVHWITKTDPASQYPAAVVTKPTASLPKAPANMLFVDLAGVPGVQEGWLANVDGTFSEPPAPQAVPVADPGPPPQVNAKAVAFLTTMAAQMANIGLLSAAEQSAVNAALQSAAAGKP